MRKAPLHLTDPDRLALQEMVRQTTLSHKAFQRASGLLALDQGQTLQQVAETEKVNYNTVAAWRDRYHQDGLQVLQDKPRSGRPPRIDGSQRAALTALACSTPPEGSARWSLRLLSQRAVELGVVEAVSHNQ